MPFYDDWHRTPAHGLSDDARAAWAVQDWGTVARELVAAAVAQDDAASLAAAVETDARTLEVSFLEPYAEEIERLPSGAVREAALALLTLRTDTADRGVLPAQAAVSALLTDEPRVAASVAIGVGMILIDRGRWMDAGWFANAARDGVARIRSAGGRDDEVEPLWFAAMSVAVIVEWNTYSGTDAFDELAAALAPPRARNLLRAHHAAALAALGHVQCGRGEFGAAAVSVARAIDLLSGSPLARAAATARFAFIKYRQGQWREARRAVRWVTESALDDIPWTRSMIAALATLEPATRVDVERARAAIDEAERALRAQGIVFAEVVVLHARIALAIGTNDWTWMLQILEAAEEPGYRREYDEHEWRTLWGMALRNAGRHAEYRALLEGWADLEGATEHPYYWAHVGLRAQLDGDGPAALAAALRAREATTYREDPLGRTWARIVVGTLVSLYGDPREGMESYETARAELSDLGADGFVRLCTRIIEGTGAEIARASGDGLNALTAQQRRVAELVADGYTSAEIGEILYLSKKTIDFHVANIVSRLGLASRRELKRRMTASR